MKRENDPRNIQNGSRIPKENYCDQPYVVIRPDGAWVCVLTTGSGVEGAVEQHCISCISFDHGESWSDPVDIEPPGPPESSWVMPYITGYGRIYAFYVYNRDNLRTVKMKNEKGFTERVDTMGSLAYRYSDNGGESWSHRRYYVPIRNFAIDRANPYQGELQFFWGVGKPIWHKGAMYLGFAKVGVFGEGFMEKDEGAFIRCGNIETERDPDKLCWETLPEGEEGLKPPEGLVADEHNLVSLDDGSLYCTYRTVAGHNAHAYSRDDGRSWTPPAFASFSPGGKLLKHPRAANFVHKYSNGKYTLWFHSHGKNLVSDPGKAYQGRNPAWLCGGIERDGHLFWSQPEVVLYGQYGEGISYPDFIEDQGEYYITETQKTIARAHHVNKALLEALWTQHENRSLDSEGLALSLESPAAGEYPCGAGGACRPGEGDSFSLQLLFDTRGLQPGILLDGRDALRQGCTLSYTAEGTLLLRMNDGERECSWESDPLPEGERHVTAIVDGCAAIISFVVDGVLCDGGERRDYGFGRIDPALGNVAGSGKVRLGENAGHIRLLRCYARYLLTSQAVGNYRYDRERMCKG